jgi:transcriptional regulator with XRE-family HTH domain
VPHAGDPLLKELATRIRAARERAGLTQEAVAARAGIDYKRYQRIEQGSVNATVRTLDRVAGAMELEFWQLVGAAPRRK